MRHNGESPEHDEVIGSVSKLVQSRPVRKGKSDSSTTNNSRKVNLVRFTTRPAQANPSLSWTLWTVYPCLPLLLFSAHTTNRAVQAVHPCPDRFQPIPAHPWLPFLPRSVLLGPSYPLPSPPFLHPHTACTQLFSLSPLVLCSLSLSFTGDRFCSCTFVFHFFSHYSTTIYLSVLHSF